MKVTRALTLAALSCLPSLAHADELVTDRPDVAESSQVVGARRFQVEVGADVSGVGASTTQLSLPTKLRYGVGERFEVHLESGLLSASFTQAETSAALDKVDVGAKVHMLDARGARPSLGLLLALGVPTQGEEVDLRPTLAADWGLADWLGLGTNLGLTLPLTQRETSADAVRWASALGFDLGAFAPVPIGIYAEVFGEFWPGAFVRVQADAGLTYMITDLVQLDAYARTSIYGADEVLGLGSGVSVKF